MGSLLDSQSKESMCLTEWLKLKGIVEYTLSCISLGASADILHSALMSKMTEFEERWISNGNLLSGSVDEGVSTKGKSDSFDCVAKNDDAVFLEDSEPRLVEKSKRGRKSKSAEPDKSQLSLSDLPLQEEKKEVRVQEPIVEAEEPTKEIVKSVVDTEEPIEVENEELVEVEVAEAEPVEEVPKPERKIDESLSVYASKLTSNERRRVNEVLTSVQGTDEDKRHQAVLLTTNKIMNGMPLTRFYALRNRDVIAYIEIQVDQTKAMKDALVWRVLKGSKVSARTSKLNYSQDLLDVRNGIIKTYAERCGDSDVFEFRDTVCWISSTLTWLGYVVLGNYNSLSTRLSAVSSVDPMYPRLVSASKA